MGRKSKTNSPNIAKKNNIKLNNNIKLKNLSYQIRQFLKMQNV